MRLVRNECQQTDEQREGRPSEHLPFLDWQVAPGEEGAGKLEGAVQNLSSVHLVLCRDLQGPEMDTNEMYRNEMNCKTWVILKYKKMVLSSTP